MKIIKAIVLFPLTIVKLFIKGFKQLSLFLSRGFYFYFEKLFIFLKKITHINALDKTVSYFRRRKEEPSHIVMIIVWFLTFLFLFDTLYVDNTNYTQSVFEGEKKQEKKVIKEKQEKKEEEQNLLLNKEMNLYRIYGKYGIEDINFDTLKASNEDTIAWIMVEGTNINYPVVQTEDNDYYLHHSYDKSYTSNGWIFMDYRNGNRLEDNNTIFYGHNLLNKTGFGSLDKVFKSKKKNIQIKVMTDDRKMYTYEVFSAYYIEPEVYYLQTYFSGDNEYQSFLNTISGRNIIGVDNTVTTEDRIITLSTCTDDNKGRKVVHAKLIKSE